MSTTNMCDCYEELADIEEMETLKRAAKKQKPRQEVKVEAAPIAN